MVNLIVDKEVGELNKEQEVLDRHDDDIEAIAVRHQQLITKYGNPTGTTGVRKSSSRKLSRLERCLNNADEEITAVRNGQSKVPLLEQYREQLIITSGNSLLFMRISLLLIWMMVTISLCCMLNLRSCCLVVPSTSRSYSVLILLPCLLRPTRVSNCPS